MTRLSPPLPCRYSITLGSEGHVVAITTNFPVKMLVGPWLQPLARISPSLRGMAGQQVRERADKLPSLSLTHTHTHTLARHSTSAAKYFELKRAKTVTFVFDESCASKTRQAENLRKTPCVRLFVDRKVCFVFLPVCPKHGTVRPEGLFLLPVCVSAHVFACLCVCVCVAVCCSELQCLKTTQTKLNKYLIVLVLSLSLQHTHTHTHTHIHTRTHTHTEYCDSNFQIWMTLIWIIYQLGSRWVIWILQTAGLPSETILLFSNLTLSQITDSGRDTRSDSVIWLSTTFGISNLTECVLRHQVQSLILCCVEV